MSGGLYAMSEGVELAAFRCMLALQAAQKDDIRTGAATCGGNPGFGC